MNKWFTELKQLDLKNPGGWPWPFKIVSMVLIFILILVAGYLLSYQTQLENLAKEEKKEVELKNVFVEKKKTGIKNRFDKFAPIVKVSVGIVANL